MKTIELFFHQNGEVRLPANGSRRLQVSDTVAAVLEGSYISSEDIRKASDFYAIAGNALDDLLRLEIGSTDPPFAFIDCIRIVPAAPEEGGQENEERS